MSETTPGIYHHYKGGRYRVLFTAKMSTNGLGGRLQVVYVSLTKGTIHVRDEIEFREIVNVDNKSRFRFARIGDSINEND